MPELDLFNYYFMAAFLENFNLRNSTLIYGYYFYKLFRIYY